jgi:16S rRNA (guanine(966)-N(2))-methyltransferase RsmD
MNILSRRLAGARWLDLCCGSGVMACEALQRGVERVVAVERDRRIAAVAEANLAAVAAGLTDGGGFQVHQREVLAWLGQSCSAGPGGKPGRAQTPGFDLIYADPPYRAGLHGPIATAVAAGGWLNPGGLLLWECASDGLPAIPPGWQQDDCRRYGGTTVLLLSRASAAQDSAPAVLVPGGHEQPHKGDGNQTQHDAAKQGFDHGQQVREDQVHNSSTSGVPLATPRHQP